MDALEGLSQLEDKSMDLIFTDPPYRFTAADRNKGSGFYKRTNHLADIAESFGTDFNPLDFLSIAIKKSRNGLLVWSPQKLLLDYIHFAIDNKMKWDLQFWHKSNCCPNHHNHLLLDTEFIIRLYPAGAYFNNSLNYACYHKYFIGYTQSIKGHPTPKPLNVTLQLLQLFTKENDIICDPYIGSGTLALACKQSHRNFIGWDNNPEYVKMANKRISKIQGSLF